MLQRDKPFILPSEVVYYLLMYQDLEKYRTETGSQYAIITFFFPFSVLETSSILTLRNVVHSSQIICPVLSLTLFKLGERQKEKLNFLQLFINSCKTRKATTIC